MSQSQEDKKLNEAKLLLQRLLEIDATEGVFDRYGDGDVWHSEELDKLFRDVEKFFEQEKGSKDSE
jgi:hypothetical protein